MIKPLLLSVLPYALSAAIPASASTGSIAAASWSENKCALYRSADDDARSILGAAGMRPGFLEKNEQFIAGGCQDRGNVCPQSEKEIEFANLLTIMTMNEGMASTFVPFGCGD